MSARTTQLLSSGGFYRLRYDTVPVKSASANVFSIPVTKKYQILSCDTLVANERYIDHIKHNGNASLEKKMVIQAVVCSVSILFLRGIRYKQSVSVEHVRAHRFVLRKPVYKGRAVA